MLVFVGSVGEHLREDGEATTVSDNLAPAGVRLKVPVAKTLAGASCPHCGAYSERVHSTYRRGLQDLPLQGVAVTLQVVVRRFRCGNGECSRQTFAETFAEIAPRRAQRTQRMAAAQTTVGLMLGGVAGARLLRVLGGPTSPSTLLRLTRRAPLPETPTPRVLGVDDWAIRRGHTYGTVLVDQERHRPVALLAGRESAPLAQWLQEHPGVEIITRDRAEAYAQGAAQGAPNAVQVADRWHLFKNASDALERVLQRHRAALVESADAVMAPAVEPAVAEAAPTAPSSTEASPHANSTPGSSSLVAARQAARQALYDDVQRLHAEGFSIYAIGERLQVSRPTVRKYLRSPSCPKRAPRRTTIGTLSKMDTHLRARWAEGCHDAKVLWEELSAMGYRGSLRSVQRHIAPWGSERRSRRRRQRPSPAPRPPTAKAPSPRLARWWLILPSEKLSTDQRRFVDDLVSRSDAVRTARELVVEFGRLLRERDLRALHPWLEAARACPHSELRELAAGLRRDLSAVEAAVMVTWSNGQTEGQVNKLKVLKRQCYGRAKLDLLERRLLAA